MLAQKNKEWNNSFYRLLQKPSNSWWLFYVILNKERNLFIYITKYYHVANTPRNNEYYISHHSERSEESLQKIDNYSSYKKCLMLNEAFYNTIFYCGLFFGFNSRIFFRFRCIYCWNCCFSCVCFACISCFHLC